MPKKSYPGGFRLTLATARRLAVQEFGTAKGLGPYQTTDLEGFFKMEMGNLHIHIRSDMGMSGCIQVDVSSCATSYATNHRIPENERQRVTSGVTFPHNNEKTPLPSTVEAFSLYRILFD